MRIVIDGTIGSGKTTQLGLLESKGYNVVREPIDQWSLDLFYKDRSRWAFMLQLQVLCSFQVKGQIWERCPMSSNYVFWKNLYNKKIVSEIENETYHKYYNKFGWQPDIYILLACSPEVAYERIKARRQVGDKSISIDYLRDLDKLYNDLVRNMPCKVYVLNTEQMSEDDIHAKIISILESENAVQFLNGNGSKVSATGSARREVLCTPFTGMCSMS
jgi:deoxyadenosine/deoxycytidine kinase